MEASPSVIQDQSFWDGWEDRFVENVNEYVTPQNDTVAVTTRPLLNTGLGGPEQDVMSIWEFIHNNVKYELSKEWKTPQQTLESRVGDCEDMDFLALSMLGYMGASSADLVVGNYIGDQKKGAHTWVEVNNIGVVDPTARPGNIKEANYHEERRMTVNFQGCSSCH